MIGHTIHNYQIVEKLGEGGMGVVYKARDLRLDRFVALKFLPQHLTTNDEEKQRFIHEAKAASVLEHNHICTIHEINETEDGQLFIVMGYYEGETLEKKIDTTSLSVDETLDIISQIAAGLARAHEKGIVHRDIKPANIMYTEDGVVKILDFGLAKLSTQTRLTKEGSTLGTIAYMSPEQSGGESVDARTDIWSLGVIMYEMLTGQLPFKGSYDQAIIYSILNEKQTPVTEIRSDIPKILEYIIDKALEKDPGQRYKTISDLLADLESALGDGKKSVPEGKSSEPDAKKIKPVYWYTGLVVLLTVLAIMVWYIIIPAPDNLDSIAVLPLENLSGDEEQEYFADGMTDALISELARFSGLRVISRTSVMRYKKVSKPIAEIARELDVAVLLEGTVLYDGEQIRITVQLIQAQPEQHLWAEDYKRELRDIFELQEDVARNIAAQINVTVTPEEELNLSKGRPVDPDVYKLYLKANHYRDTFTIDGLQKSAELYHQVLEKDAVFAPAYVGLAQSHLALGFRTGMQDETLAKFHKYAQKAIELDDSESETHRMLAMISFYVDWDLNSAKQELEKALDLNPNSAEARDLYCQVLMVLGHFDQAIIEREKSIALDPLSHSHHCNGGFTYLWAGKYDQAIAMAEKTTEQFGAACSAEDMIIGMAYNQKAMYAEAIAVLEKRNEMSPNNPRIVAELAVAQALSGNKEEARRMMAELNEFNTARFGHPAYYLSAVIYTALGEKDEALTNLEKSYETEEWLFPWVKFDQRFAAIRSDTRFTELTNKLKF